MTCWQSFLSSFAPIMASKPAPLLGEEQPDPFLRVSVLLMPEFQTEHYFTLFKQCGVTDIVSPLPSDPTDLEALRAIKARIEGNGLRLSVLERYWKHDAIVQNMPGKRKQIDDTKALIRNMGILGIPVLCYNWMQSSDWSRTSVTSTTRGNALVSEFNALEPHKELGGQAPVRRAASSEELWASLKAFLTEVIPVCEESGVSLSLHPDDPPMPSLNGRDQIFFNAEMLERAAKLVPSPANGICFGQGTLASAGDDIPGAIRRLAPYINFIHFRDVVGTVPHFKEVWQDNGKTDMVAAMHAFHDAGVRNVCIRPDHVPTLVGEDNRHPGYHMLGRLFALGYMKALMQSAEQARRHVDDDDAEKPTSKL